MKLKITLLFITLISTLSIAQNKVGTIDSDYIINLMPETKIVIERVQNYGAKLDSSFTIKVTDFQVKLDTFKKNEKKMGALEKKVNIKELNALDQDIQKYKENGNALMGLKRDELMRPLYRKLNKVISEVAKEKGYSQIFTRTGNQFAYIDEKFDITDLVLDKLGIVVPKETE